MINKALKYYVVAFYLCSNFVMFAQPGTGSDNGGIDDNGNGDITPASIDDFIWVIVFCALLYAFLKFRLVQKNRSNG